LSEKTYFKPGDRVALVSSPEVYGIVIEIIGEGPEPSYRVFIENTERTFYQRQLVPYEKKEELTGVSKHEFFAYLSALHLLHPGRSYLFSLNAARIEFIPYQFRPVLKFLRSERPRILIADDVGVGKTIEAGLVLKEIEARQKVNRVAIICPRSLVVERKWEREMERFDEKFIPLTSSSFRFCINEAYLDEWPEQYNRFIISYSLFTKTNLLGKGRQKGLLGIDPPPKFDVVIVDEAHHIRNPGTRNYKAVKFFCENAEVVIFLTATPIQLGSDDLFVLLNLLRPEIVTTPEVFRWLTEPNPFIFKAAKEARENRPGWEEKTLAYLEEVTRTEFGKLFFENHPKFQTIVKILKSVPVPHEERVKLILTLEELHTLSGIINRTRRRDIAKDFPVRKPITYMLRFTPSQQELYDLLMETLTIIYSRLYGDRQVKFVLSTIYRQAASCLYGLKPFLEDLLLSKLKELELSVLDIPEGKFDEGIFETIKSYINEVMHRAEHIDSHDPKLEKLVEIILEKQKLENHRVMVFSSFRHTLSYIYDQLLSRGFRVGIVHGDTPDEERRELRRRFALPKAHEEALDTLLFSEIGSEGLDYQFCDCLINYDLPWNPMRIEQRIGRIDRLGQKSEKIVIYNLITEGTIDADIYERCLTRIGIFERTLGGSDEILGEIAREIHHIAQDFSLSSEERRIKLSQLADNEIRKIQELERLEKEQSEFLGLEIPIEEELKQAENPWLSPEALENLVELYLRKVVGRESDFILGEGKKKTLRLSREARSKLLEDFTHLPRENNPSYREWRKWLEGDDPYLSITFDREYAADHQEIMFITLFHPLVRQAAESFRLRGPISVSFRVKLPGFSGEYPFVVYLWRYRGLREDVKLKFFALLEELEKYLSRLIFQAEDFSVSEVPSQKSFWKPLEERQYSAWCEELQRYKEEAKKIVERRLASLERTYQARKQVLTDQSERAEDERIRRMREGELRRVEEEFQKRQEELLFLPDCSDIETNPIVYGMVKVEQ